MKDLGQGRFWIVEIGEKRVVRILLTSHSSNLSVAELLCRISLNETKKSNRCTGNHRGQRSSTQPAQEALKFKMGASPEFWSELSCNQEITAPRMLAVLNSLIRSLSFPSLAACEPLRHFRIILEINVLTVARPEITNHNIDYNYQYFPCRGVFCLHNRLWSSPARPVIIV